MFTCSNIFLIQGSDNALKLKLVIDLVYYKDDAEELENIFQNICD